MDFEKGSEGAEDNIDSTGRKGGNWFWKAKLILGEWIVEFWTPTCLSHPTPTKPSTSYILEHTNPHWHSFSTPLLPSNLPIAFHLPLLQPSQAKFLDFITLQHMTCASLPPSQSGFFKGTEFFKSVLLEKFLDFTKHKAQTHKISVLPCSWVIGNEPCLLSASPVCTLNMLLSHVSALSNP